MKIEIKNVKYNKSEYVDTVEGDIYVDRKPFSKIDFDGNSFHNSKHDDNPSSYKEFHQQLPEIVSETQYKNSKEFLQLVFLSEQAKLYT